MYTPEELEFIKTYGVLPPKPRRAGVKPKKRTKRNKAPENAVKIAVTHYLRLKGYFYWRNNQIGVPLNNGTGRYRPSAAPGSPDLFVINHRKGGQLVGLELKSATGKASDAQKLFGAKIVEAGGVFGVVRSVDDVIALGL